MIPDCDGRSDGQTESIIANTALCIASYTLTRCKNGSIYVLFVVILTPTSKLSQMTPNVTRLLCCLRLFLKYVLTVNHIANNGNNCRLKIVPSSFISEYNEV